MRPKDAGLALARALALQREQKFVPVTIESVRELNERVAASQRVRDELRSEQGKQLARNLRVEPSCTKHAWGVSTPSKPAPPASLCPHCAKERRAEEHARESRRETRYVAYSGKVTPRADELQNAKLNETYGTNGVGPTGQVRPGSQAEKAAIAVIDDARAEFRSQVRDTPERRRARARRFWSKRFRVPAGDGNWRNNVNAIHASRT
jgi:hypothetical protein